MTRGLNASAAYMKCQDEHSGLEFQVKLLLRNEEIYVEFSCGCSIKADSSTNPFSYLFPPIFFAGIFSEGLKKVFGRKDIRKNQSLWSCARFEKTPHHFCPRDPQLFALLIKVIHSCRVDIADYLAIKLKLCRANTFQEHLRLLDVKAFIAEAVKKLKSDEGVDYSAIARDFLMPYFKNTATMPDPEKYCKDRKLPKQSKEALQVQSHENSEKRLTDEQLMALFEETPAQQRKSKSTKNKPNKGKTQSAIRKTQKPVKL